MTGSHLHDESESNDTYSEYIARMVHNAIKLLKRVLFQEPLCNNFISGGSLVSRLLPFRRRGLSWLPRGYLKYRIPNVF